MPIRSDRGQVSGQEQSTRKGPEAGMSQGLRCGSQLGWTLCQGHRGAAEQRRWEREQICFNRRGGFGAELG